MPERNPRTTPIVGDVFARGGAKVEVQAVYPTVIVVCWSNPPHLPWSITATPAWVNMGRWKAWASTADVLRRGDA